MATITIFDSVALDGVLRGPGRPDEDTGSGFTHGGWAAPYADEVSMQFAGEGLATGGGLLFGRRTYEDLLGFWTTTPEPTLAASPAQPSLATAAGPLPIPAPGPPHRVVPQRSTLLLLPRISPKVAGLRHPNRAPKIDLSGVRPGLQRHHPANHVPPKAEDVETATGYPVSFRRYEVEPTPCG